MGSTTVKLAVLNDDNQIVYAKYQRHHTDVRACARDLFVQAAAVLPEAQMTCAITGSGGLLLSQWLGLEFVQEVIASKRAVETMIPQTDVAIELGGEDAKIIYFDQGIEQRMNGTCAGGTGAFIDQMATLLHTDASGLNELAKGATTIYPIASRCGVFAKSDVQPLLNEGARQEDVAASIFQAVVTQTISGLACGRPIRGNVAFLGGPLQYLSELRERFYITLELDEEHRIVPENAHLFVASGAAMAHESEKLSTFPELIAAIDALGDTQGSEVVRLDPLFATDADYKEFKQRHDQEVVPRGELEGYQGRVFIGLDAGSTTMKAAMVGEDGQLLYTGMATTTATSWARPRPSWPISTRHIPAGGLHHRPCDHHGLRRGAPHRGAQGRLGRDRDRCSPARCEGLPAGRGVHLGHRRPGHEVSARGGRRDRAHHAQRSLLLGLRFLHRELRRVHGTGCRGIRREAIGAPHPVDLGSRCTVFMNSRVKQAQKEGATVGDIAAGLSYSVMKNALFKVIKLRDPKEMGTQVIVQGGTFMNDAILRAFELLTGVNAVRPDIAGCMGALRRRRSRARPLPRWAPRPSSPREEIAALTVTQRSCSCGRCSNNCQLTINDFGGGRRFITRQPLREGRGQPRQEAGGAEPLRRQERPALQPLRLAEERRPARHRGHPPRPQHVRELSVLVHAFFTKLGFRVVLSDDSRKKTYDAGIESMPSESVCYPAKLSHGHVMNLIDKHADFIWMPCIRWERKEDPARATATTAPSSSYPRRWG